MRKIIPVLLATIFLLSGCNARAGLPAVVPGTPGAPVETHKPPEIRPDPSKVHLSEELYAPGASVADWEPYFTGEEPVWNYNPDKPWASFIHTDNSYSQNQAPAMEAHQVLYSYFMSSNDYAGCYVNCNGYLTVLLVGPTIERALEIAELSPSPLWIIAAEYSYKILDQAQQEAVRTIIEWIDEHPDIPAAFRSSGVYDDDNRVRLSLQGSGVPLLLSAFDFPDCIEIIYTPTITASERHDVPRIPVIAWEKDGVTIKSAYVSYPVGTTSLFVTASHNVENMRLYAPDAPLSVEKNADGEWYDISGSFSIQDIYCEILDIPAGEKKTVELRIVTPETLGPGLYRARFGGHVCLSSTGDTTTNSAIAGISGKDIVTFEFLIAEDAVIDTVMSAADQAKAYYAVFTDLYGKDSALQHDCTYLALDLTNVLLADVEPLVDLFQRFCDNNGYSLLLDTFEGLKEKGYIVDLYFPDGFLISFSDAFLNGDAHLDSSCLITNAQKWRSGTGAIGAKYTVKKSGNSWVIDDITNCWIS